MVDENTSELSFEEAMIRLEKVVDALEKPEVSLSESIKLYERGAALKKRCEEELKKAEQKITAITLDVDGNPTGVEPLDRDEI